MMSLWSSIMKPSAHVMSFFAEPFTLLYIAEYVQQIISTVQKYILLQNKPQTYVKFVHFHIILHTLICHVATYCHEYIMPYYFHSALYSHPNIMQLTRPAVAGLMEVTEVIVRLCSSMKGFSLLLFTEISLHYQTSIVSETVTSVYIPGENSSWLNNQQSMALFLGSWMEKIIMTVHTILRTLKDEIILQHKDLDVILLQELEISCLYNCIQNLGAERAVKANKQTKRKCKPMKTMSGWDEGLGNSSLALPASSFWNSTRRDCKTVPNHPEYGIVEHQ